MRVPHEHVERLVTELATDAEVQRTMHHIRDNIDESMQTDAESTADLVTGNYEQYHTLLALAVLTGLYEKIHDDFMARQP